MSSKQSTRKSVTTFDLLLVACAIIFVVGLIWGFAGFSQRKSLYRQALAAKRDAVGLQKIELKELEALNQLKDRLNLVENQSEESGESKHSLSGIELSARIQSFVHESRMKLDESGIIIEDRNFGFQDYVREVAVNSDSRDSLVLSMQLDIVRLLIGELINSQPIALLSVKRSVESHEIEGVGIVDPTTGISDVESSSFHCDIKVSLEFEGYTRSLRGLLNALNSNGMNARIVALSVTCSNRSEEDKSGRWMKGAEIDEGAAVTLKSPFSSYLDDEEAGDNSIETETHPLIGEVVSRFRITFEKGVTL